MLAVVYSWRIDAGVSALLAATQKQHAVIQQAYWYPAEKSGADRIGGGRKQKPNRFKDKYRKPQATKEKSSAMSDSDSLYTFLILKENGEDSEDDIEDGTTTINLSGGLIAPKFEHTIIEDYLAKPKPSDPVITKVATISSSGHVVSSTIKMNSEGASAPTNTPLFPGSVPQKSKILPFDVDDGTDDNVFDNPDHPDGTVDQLDDSRQNLISSGQKKNSNISSQFYWTQVQLRRRIQHHVMSSDWWDYTWYYKIATALDYPSILLRDITIPTTDTELWSRFNAVLQPVFAPIFLLAVAGEHTKHVGAMPITLFSMMVCLAPAIVVFLTTHTSRPPSGRFGGIWVAFSFMMCIAWIYLLAGELVACLSAVGGILGIPSSFMGLTILAWGNSVGDYFANVAVAKQGYSEMAVTGCIGGPIFNMFIGLGLSFFVICAKEYPAPFKITFDATSVISLMFLFFTLLGTLVTVIYRNYVIDKDIGYMLLGFYVFYTLVQFLLLL